MLLQIAQANQGYIKKINPNIPSYQVEQISHSVDKYSKEFSIKKELIMAIIEKESTFDITRVSKTKDYGLMQINIRTIKSFNFNFYRLQYDIDYSIFCGIVYLILIKRNYTTDNYWWARYHSSTPIYKNIYIKEVERIMRRQYEFTSN
jgi:membrane-bound lytic murein transglycosylase MltF